MSIYKGGIVSWFMTLGLLVFCVSASGSLTSQLLDLTGGKRVKLVWEESPLVVGFDTQDSTKRILDSGAIPLLTHDGSRVVYMGFGCRDCRIIDWNGGPPRIIHDGFGYLSCLWYDKIRHQEFLVAGNSSSRCQLDMFNIDSAAESARIWDTPDATPEWTSFSNDGTRFLAGFPWPTPGVLDMATRSLTMYGTLCGCNYFFVPDNSGRFFMMVNSQPGFSPHRNWLMFDSTQTMLSSVRLIDAPGINGWPVFDPRFSNQPRYLTMDGPYTGGSTAPCWTEDCGAFNTASGPFLEIYFGRMDSDLTRVESWVRVTNDSIKSRMPSAWVDDSEPPLGTGRPTPPVSPNRLAANPNPFQASTSITYQLAAGSIMNISIYTPAGRLVKTLVQEFRPAGLHTITWHSADQPAGLYIIKLHAGNFEIIRRILLIK